MHRAWLLIRFRIDSRQSFPAFVDVGIYSAQTPTQRSKDEFYACLAEISANTFADAGAELLAMCKRTKHLRWTLPYVKKTWF